MGSHSLLQDISPTQGSNPDLLHADSLPAEPQDDIILRFWFVFPWWLVMLSTFLCTCWLFIYLLWENMCLILLPVFNWVFFFFLALSYASSSYLSDITAYQIHVVYNCFPFHSKSLFILFFLLLCGNPLLWCNPICLFCCCCCLHFMCHILKVSFLMFVVVSVVSFRTLSYIL